MPDIFVRSFTHLKDKPKADQALNLLQRVASLVKPIMRKHGWTLPVLSEFYPEEPNLLGLNINGGEKIMVRLRSPHAPDSFLPEENVVGTMLHELTHNIHGPHDAAFYKFLSGLEDEYDALRRSGYAGEGFHAPGQRLGTNVSHNLPPHIARAKAAEAADKRRQVSVVMRGGVRLGGVPRRNANKSPRELAAEAAERRARDELACASGAVAQREAEKAAKESIRNDVIDLTGDSDSEPEILIIDEPASPSSESPSGPESAYPPSAALDSSSSPTSSSTLLAAPDRTTSSSSISSLSSTTSTSSSRMPRPVVKRVPLGAGDAQPKIPKPRSHSRVAAQGRSVTPSTPTPPPTRAGSIAIPRHVREHPHPLVSAHAPPPASTIPLEREWECPRCTLMNDALALQCAACLGVRPNPPTPAPKEERKADGWKCGVCGEEGMPHDFWSCRFCGSVKATS